MFRGEIYLQQRSNSTAALLVVSNNACNAHSDKVTCVPIARVVKRNMPTHVVIPAGSFSGQMDPNCVALCEKIQMINKDTLQGPIAVITDPVCMGMIGHALQVQIGIFEAYTQPSSFFDQKVPASEQSDAHPFKTAPVVFGA